MKSLKKTLVLLVVFAMIFGTIAPAFAATDVAGLDCEEEVARMEALGIINGFEDGTYGPEKTITRAEMAKIVCKMVGIDETTVAGSANIVSKFSDVVAGEWYAGYVNVAAGRGIISGFPDGTFRPSETLTMNQVLTLCVNALGRGEYVAAMGTWPANYIAEAAKLGLMDGVKSSDANRGNVAIIAWNALKAPVWDVTGTEYNGSINLGADNNTTLLSIHFRDFVNDDGRVKEIEDLEITNIDDRQLVVASNKIVDAKNVSFADEFQNKPSKNRDEKSYVDNNTAYIYVPEEVCEDLDDLMNKTITILLGEDNVAALITIEDDIVDKDFLTKFENNKIVVGGTSYKLDDDYTVTLNGATDVYVEIGTLADTNAFATVPGTKYTYAASTYTAANAYTDNTTVYFIKIDEESLPEALYLLGVNDFEDIEKAIEATVILGESDRVGAIELSASATIDGISAEALVTKVKESKTAYKISTTAGDFEWDPDDEDDLEFPKVYIDGVKGEIRDIEAGNVITAIGVDALTGNDDFVEDIAKIYVSTKTATGEATKVKKANNAITVDSEVYYASVDPTGKSIMTSEELKDDDWDPYVTATILDNDEVTLYLNTYGEYVAISLEETSSSDWEFGVVTVVYDKVSYEGDDDEIETKDVKILTGDANKGVRYTIKADTSDDEFDEGDLDAEITETHYLNKLVMFTANADKVIDLEDFYPVDKSTLGALDGSNAGTLNDIFQDKYKFEIANDVTKVNGKRIDIADAGASYEYRYSADTAIFNVGRPAGIATDVSGNNYVICSKSDAGAMEVKGGANTNDPAAAGVGGAAGTIGLTTANTKKASIEDDFEAGEYVKVATNDDIEKIDIEVINDWESIITANNKFVTNAIIVVKDGKEIPSCIALLVPEYTKSDAMYAVVDEELDVTKDDKEYAKLLADGSVSESIQTHKNFADGAAIVEGAFVEYTTSSDKLRTASKLVDVLKFNKLATNKVSTAVTEAILLDGTDAKVAWRKANDATKSVLDSNVTTIWRENFEVREIITDDDDYEIKYVEISDADGNTQIKELPSLFIEKKEVTVYDLRDGGFEEITMNELIEAVDEDIFVIGFKNADQTDDNYDANVLVVL